MGSSKKMRVTIVLLLMSLLTGCTNNKEWDERHESNINDPNSVIVKQVFHRKDGGFVMVDQDNRWFKTTDTGYQDIAIESYRIYVDAEAKLMIDFVEVKNNEW